MMNSLRSALPGFAENMLVFNMLRIDLCVRGAFTEDNASADEFHNRRVNIGIYYSADVMIPFRLQVRCGNNRRMIRYQDYAYGDDGVNFDLQVRVPGIDFRNKRRYPVSSDANVELREDLMNEAFYIARHEMKDALKSYLEDKEKECVETLKLKFEDKQKKRADDVAQTEAVKEALKSYDAAATEANAYLSAWVRLSLNDAIALSDPVAAIATGKFRFPVWEDTESYMSWDRHQWHRPDRLEEGIRAVEEVLRSEHVQYMARHHAGYAVVTGTAYDSLDPKIRRVATTSSDTAGWPSMRRRLPRPASRW